MSPNSMEAIRQHGFQPGYDPRRNLGGRPKKPLTEALRILAGELASDGKTYAENAARAVFETALGGSASAFETIRDTIEGKPRQEQAIDLNVDRSLPPLTEEEYERGLGTRGYCNEWWSRLTDDQLVLKLEEMLVTLKRPRVATERQR